MTTGMTTPAGIRQNLPFIYGQDVLEGLIQSFHYSIAALDSRRGRHFVASNIALAGAGWPSMVLSLSVPSRKLSRE